MGSADKAGREDFALRLEAVRRRQDANLQEKRALEEAREIVDEFFAGLGQWQQKCENAGFSDPHSRGLIESLEGSAASAKERSLQLGDDALAENRRERLALEAERDGIVEERARASQRRAEEGR